MPVRRRKQKRNAGIEAWRTFLECGHDFFGDLATIGIDEPVPADAALAAWQMYRDQLRNEWAVTRHPSLGPAWAERTFEDAST